MDGAGRVAVIKRRAFFQAQFFPLLRRLCPLHIRRVLARERELRQFQRVGAVGRRFARWDQLVGRRDRVGDVRVSLQKQMFCQRRHLRPVGDVRPKLERQLRLRFAPSVIDAVFINLAVEHIDGLCECCIKVGRGREHAAVAGCRRNRARVHQRDRGNLAVSGLGAFAVREVSC